jgi:hypothetical protein
MELIARCKARLLAATIAVSTVALGQMAPASAAGGVTLHYTFKAGQTTTYTISVKVDQMQVTQRSSSGDKLTLTQRVQKAAADGSALLQVSYSNSTASVAGMVSPLDLKAVSVSQRLAQDGTVLATQTSGISKQNNLTYLASGLNTHPIMPKATVSMGQSWTMPQQLTLGHFGVFPVKQRFQLKAVTTKGGHKVAQIAVSGSQPVHTTQGPLVESGTLGSSGTIQFDTTSGTLSVLHEQVQQKLTVKATAGASKGHSATITFTATVDVARKS